MISSPPPLLIHFGTQQAQAWVCSMWWIALLKGRRMTRLPVKKPARHRQPLTDGSGVLPDLSLQHHTIKRHLRFAVVLFAWRCVIKLASLSYSTRNPTMLDNELYSPPPFAHPHVSHIRATPSLRSLICVILRHARPEAHSSRLAKFIRSWRGTPRAGIEGRGRSNEAGSSLMLFRAKTSRSLRSTETLFCSQTKDRNKRHWQRPADRTATRAVDGIMANFNIHASTHIQKKCLKRKGGG
jgi:hypothetical protein